MWQWDQLIECTVKGHPSNIAGILFE
jgi:hypothetical protein